MSRQQQIDKETTAAREAIRGRQGVGGAGAPSGPGGAGGAPGAPIGEATHAVINVATAATHTLISGVSARRIAVYEVVMWTVVEQSFELLDGADSLTGPWNNFPALSCFFLPNTGEPHFKLQSGLSLNLTLSAAGQVSGFVLYRYTEE